MPVTESLANYNPSWLHPNCTEDINNNNNKSKYSGSQSLKGTLVSSFGEVGAFLSAFGEVGFDIYTSLKIKMYENINNRFEAFLNRYKR